MLKNNIMQKCKEITYALSYNETLSKSLTVGKYIKFESRTLLNHS